MASVSGTRDVAVVTVFTESGEPPHTRAASSFLRQCSAQSARELFEARRQEDAAALSGLGFVVFTLEPQTLYSESARRPRWSPITSGAGYLKWYTVIPAIGSTSLADVFPAATGS
ncbi:hypothetical protein ACRQ5B_09420 [Pseudarthrobacter sp. L19]|uniref:hypothetical protein n=1 Tax=Pseudarthrobacter sp. L19 TaxID=3423951 RepID=UPI003D7A5D58